MGRTNVKVVAIAAGICIILIYTIYHVTRPALTMESSDSGHKMRLGSSNHNDDPTSTKEAPPKPLLTVFTTFKEAGIIPHHQLSFNIVVSNWPSFRPLVRPVMFLSSTNSSMAHTALMFGWDVIPMTRVNQAGTPFLRDMYQTVFNRYDSRLYGYANGDLLFDDGFTKTLGVVVDQLTLLKNNVLLTGIRTNVDVDLSKPISVEDFEKARLKELTKQRGRLFQGGAVDYFFLTKDGCSLNWTSLLDVVIGRPAYGTYLVAMAANQGVSIIDTTQTVLAVHLSEKGVLSHGSMNPDAEYNRQLIGSEFRHSDGYPKNAKLATILLNNGSVVLKKRH